MSLAFETAYAVEMDCIQKWRSRLQLIELEDHVLALDVNLEHVVDRLAMLRQPTQGATSCF